MQKKSEESAKIRDFSSLTDEEIKQFKELLERVTGDYLEQLKHRRDSVPVGIFVKELSPLQAVVKYLKESLDYSHKKISVLLNRSPKTVWQAYDSSRERFPDAFDISISKYFIPLSMLAQRDFSILELVVAHLKEEYGLENNQLAKLLHRDGRTIWTAYSRLTKKRKVIRDRKK